MDVYHVLPEHVLPEHVLPEHVVPEQARLNLLE
jgi:hypothetical protein